MTISEPEAFTPGEYAFGGEEFEQHVMFDVTIENNSGEDYDPSMAYVTASSGGAEGDSVFDSDSGLGGTSTTTVTDGQSTTWQEGFGVNDPADINVEFTDLDFELMRESVLFVSE
ncbi:hypothetical protein BG28_14335 [Nesterenkonia sp. AN1]|uniref:hypothetical protein n=1 Tax=Nesterenkonia sp. AN1 TaxID=652017 RepID=UPI00044D757A|nr:hypothetical protein [Nesterenkonia sp. AN1]EXF25268.1 hypothetical protein BG28_14335 [Nesterenkonia sp. AN1]